MAYNVFYHGLQLEKPSKNGCKLKYKKNCTCLVLDKDVILISS